MQKWQATHAGLFTFAQSGKHVHLYQKFGFWPRFLTSIMSKPLEATSSKSKWAKYSDLTGAEKEQTIAECKTLTGEIYGGLDLRKEIYSIDKQRLGYTILTLMTMAANRWPALQLAIAGRGLKRVAETAMSS